MLAEKAVAAFGFSALCLLVHALEDRGKRADAALFVIIARQGGLSMNALVLIALEAAFAAAAPAPTPPSFPLNLNDALFGQFS